MSVRTVVKLLEVLGCVFYTEARGVRDIRDITSMPASDWQNIQEIRAE